MNLARDIRYALRGLRLNPGFASVAVIAIALGVGANTALYSILNAIWLRPLAVEKPEQIVALATTNTSFSYPVYRELSDRNQTLQGLIANRTNDVHIGWNGAVENGVGVLVSGNYFSLLRVGTVAGTPITPEDDVTPVSGGARGPVAVVSHAYWQRRMGGARDIVGKPIYLNGSPFTISGVAEPGFTGLEVGISPDVFAPMMAQSVFLSGNALTMQQPLNVWLRIFGRLRPDVPATRAAADLTGVWQQFFQHQVTQNLTADRRKQLVSRQITLSDASAGVSGLRRRYAQPLTILMSIAGFVLLIACANVASLLLTRATGRQREISIRLALGATRGRLVSQLLVESLVLAVAGGVLGLFLARAIRDLALQFLPQAENLRVTLDAPVLGFSLLLALATGILFGLIPSLQATSAVRPAAGGSRFQLRQGLVVLQVALSLILLAGSGVLIRSLQNLTQLDPGFEREKVLVFNIDARRNGYTPDRAKQLVGRLLDRISQLPGVQHASMADFAPLGMNTGNNIRAEGYQARPDEPSDDPGVGSTMPGYFETMGVPLLAGRDFTPHDTNNTPKVAIVNEAFANHYFGASNPIGRRLGFGGAPFEIEIVGLVKSMKVTELREAPVRMVFMPALQRAVFGFAGGAIHVRAAGDPAALAPIVRAEVRALDSNLPVTDMTTVAQHVDRALRQDRLIARISTLFSALALLLSAVGIYGTMSFAVSRRTREIGIRMALGAERGSIAARVLKETGGLMLSGVAIGLPAAYAILRLVSGLLFGLTPADPASAAVAVAVLGVTAFLAAWIPARRASRVDPMVALRHE